MALESDSLASAIRLRCVRSVALVCRHLFLFLLASLVGMLPGAPLPGAVLPLVSITWRCLIRVLLWDTRLRMVRGRLQTGLVIAGPRIREVTALTNLGRRIFVGTTVDGATRI